MARIREVAAPPLVRDPMRDGRNPAYEHSASPGRQLQSMLRQSEDRAAEAAELGGASQRHPVKADRQSTTTGAVLSSVGYTASLADSGHFLRLISCLT